MGSVMSDDRRRRGYHHGDLKNALIDAARRLIAERGANGFTMAEAARLAGVSASAPYRHFADRDALLQDVAADGFGTFADRLEAAWSDPSLTPLRALDAQGRAYLAFARDEPASFTAMFESGLDLGATPELSRASARALQTLERACAAVAQHLPPQDRPPPQMMASHIWALSHGTASLFARRSGMSLHSAEELLESAVAIYLRGLGLLPRG